MNLIGSSKSLREIRGEFHRRLSFCNAHVPLSTLRFSKPSPPRFSCVCRAPFRRLTLNRYFLVFLTMVLVFFLAFTDKAEAEIQVSGEAAVLMDMNSGKILWQKNQDRHLAPASTTKILTALVALEKGNLDEMVTIGINPPRVEGTRVYLETGEKQTLENLLYAMLLNSGNDAALAIAEHLAGTQEKFAVMMNERAKAAGALNSNFVNPHGLPDTDHYTTAGDLALIARAAMTNPEFAKIVATRSYPWNGKEWQSNLLNHNKMLGQYDDIIGVKTGYTVEAGQCIVAAAKRGDNVFLAVVLNSGTNDVYDDARKLLDFGFDNFETVQLLKKDEKVLTVTVDGRQLALLADRDQYYLREKSQTAMPGSEVILRELLPPLPAGSRAGEIVMSDDDGEFARVGLHTAADLKKAGVPWKDWLLSALALLFLLNLLHKIARRLRSKRRKRQMFSAGYRRRR